MHFCQNRFNRFFFLNMEMMTIQRLKMSILVFFQVLIFVALSLVCVFMMTSASVKSPSLGKSTTENSSFFRIMRPLRLNSPGSQELIVPNRFSKFDREHAISS